MESSALLRILSPVLLSTFFAPPCAAATIPDWPKVQPELLEHFQALVRFDTSEFEAPAAEYVKSVLDREGIPAKIYAKDPKRPNVVARLKGNGSKKPLLIMGHLDVVGVQENKWSVPPFSATRKDGYIYGRGTVDDKDNLATGLMLMVLLKRYNVPLDRDVILLAESGEEGAVTFGIVYMIEEHWDEIAAEYCLAEGGGVSRKGGKLVRMNVATTEKRPLGMKLVAHGPSGHGSRPLQNNAVLVLTKAVAAIGTWQPPMRMNDTTRAYFERLATVSSPEEIARYNGLENPAKSDEIQK